MFRVPPLFNLETKITSKHHFWSMGSFFSLVPQRFRRVEFQIVVTVFFRQTQLKKMKTNIRNSTHPNRCATKDIKQALISEFFYRYKQIRAIWQTLFLAFFFEQMVMNSEMNLLLTGLHFVLFLTWPINFSSSFPAHRK